MTQYAKPLFLFLLILIITNLSATSLPNDFALKDEVKRTEKPFYGKTSILILENDDGFGMKVLEDGRKIIGKFVNGKVNGYGVCHYTNGEKYIGELRNNNRHGKGLLIGTKIINGIWSDDKFVGTNAKTLSGCKIGDCSNGYGVLIYDDFTLYDGSFKDGKVDGHGICYYSDGDIYFGYWSAHSFHGQGVFYHKDGRKESGHWEKGQLMDTYEMLDFNRDIIANSVFTKGEEPSSAIESVAITVPTIKVMESKKIVTRETSTGKIWAIVVGVAKYTATTVKPLNFPDDDAYRFHSFLKSPEGGAIKDEQIRLLVDESATKVNIVKSLIELSEQATSDDVIIFYFSGHGLPGAFLPIDSDGTKDLLRYKNLLEILKTSKAKSKIIIADACHSGGLADFKGENYQKAIDNYYQAIHKSQGGLVLLMSSKVKETSIENGGLRQGVFSYFLLKGLKGAANTDSDELIRINELFDYVRTNVSFYTNDYQTPMIYGDGAIDHPIGFIRAN